MVKKDFEEKPGGRDVTYAFESLDYPAVERHVNGYYAEFCAVAADKVRLHQHPGGEFIFVLGGTLCVQIGGDEHTLEPRDSMYFDPRRPSCFSSNSFS
jgi:hypothetical protein